MSVRSSDGPSDRERSPFVPSPVVRWLVVLGTPLALALALWFHPHAGTDVYADVEPVVDRWLLLHVLLLGLFGLLGIVLYALLRGDRGVVATTGRIGIAVYLIAHTAYEAVAGIAVGLVVKNGRDLSADQSQAVESTVSSLTGDPIVGALALIGTAGCLVAVGAIAVLLRRDGAPLVPLALLFGAPLGLVAHGSVPMGPVLFAAFTVGVGWIEFGWNDSATESGIQA